MIGSMLIAVPLALGARALSGYLGELEVLTDVLLGYGLGSVVGTAIVVRRERRKRPLRATYTIGLWSLIGAASAVILYVLFELK